MSKRNIKLFLQDISNSIDKIQKYISGLSFDSFKENDLVIDAVLRNLEVIGEAARNIPEDFRSRYSMIPWKRIVAFRNVVIHEYFGVDLEIVWTIVKENLPELKEKIELILNSYDE